MSDNTAIEWTDATWNPITGCSVISPGCTNCYAMKLAGARLRNTPSRTGLTIDSKSGPVWNGQVRLNEQWLTQPLHWKKPRKIFVCAHGDLFHENVPDEWIDKVFAVMALAPQHQFQVLTKRAERMWEYLAEDDRRNTIIDEWRKLPKARSQRVSLVSGAPIVRTGFDWPLPNVWLGISAENQQRYNERKYHLAVTPAAIRFFSFEPLLSAIDTGDDLKSGLFHWAIAGGESGPGARPMHPDWARSLRDQCATAGVPFFFKQWGSWYPIYDRDKDDPDWRQCGRYPDAMTKKHHWLNLKGGIGFHGERFHVMERYNKKAAGNFLDGRQHLDFPK